MKFPKHNIEFLRDKWHPIIRLASPQSPWTTDNELAVLAELASQATVCGEVGSYKGKSAKTLSHACYGKVYCVDNSDDGTAPAFRDFLKDEITNGDVTFLQMESGQGAEWLAANKVTFDMFFVDADHTKEGVLRDLELYLPLMRKGSILCGHDYESNPYNGVAEAVNEKFGMKHTILVDSIWAIQL